MRDMVTRKGVAHGVHLFEGSRRCLTSLRTPLLGVLRRLVYMASFPLTEGAVGKAGTEEHGAGVRDLSLVVVEGLGDAGKLLPVRCKSDIPGLRRRTNLAARPVSSW